MTTSPARKCPRFYVVNPVTDRRMEVRHDSRIPVQVRDDDSGKLLSATAYDVGRRGLKIELNKHLPVTSFIHVIFFNSFDNVRCFGRVIWTTPKEGDQVYQSGIEIQAWHGIVEGPDSWTKVKGSIPKRDRRRQNR